jgi:hypothetical protein
LSLSCLLPCSLLSLPFGLVVFGSLGLWFMVYGPHHLFTPDIGKFEEALALFDKLTIEIDDSEKEVYSKSNPIPKSNLN